jgi:hypothetical protein
MNVYQLIEELQKVKDKNATVKTTDDSDISLNVIRISCSSDPDEHIVLLWAGD